MPVPPALRPMRRLLRPVAERWPWPVAARLADGRVMYVDLRSAIGRGILATGEFDPGVFVPIRRVLGPGDVFVDVGANVGYYSMLASPLVGPSGEVHAFEIDPRPIRCLRRTFGQPALENVRIHEIALGREQGRGSLTTTGEAGHTRLDRTGGGAIAMTTLDEVCRTTPITRVTAVKIDVEGGELNVLQGAEATLRTHRPLVIVEVVEEQLQVFGYGQSDVRAFLESLDYSVAPLEQVHSACYFAVSR